MSYDIAFWADKEGKRSKAQSMYARLCAGEEPADLPDAPVNNVLAALKRKFRLTFNVEKRLIEFPTGGFDIIWNRKHFALLGRANSEADQVGLQRIVEVMTKYGLRCYDPQVGIRYSLSKPPQFAPNPDRQRLRAEREWAFTKYAAEVLSKTSDPGWQTRLTRKWLAEHPSPGSAYARRSSGKKRK
jgi:hypothetical protein